MLIASVFESAHWSKKSNKRDLLTEKKFNYIMQELRKLPREINNLIGLTNKYLKR